jgi:hypothetical protein
MQAITVNLSDEIALSIMTLTTAQLVWDQIQTIFSGASYSRKLLGLLKLCSFRHEGKSVQATISAAELLVQELIMAANSKTISFEEVAVAMVMNSLPAEYGTVRSSLKEATSFAGVKAKLLAEEEVIKAAASHQEGFVGSLESTTTACSHWHDETKCFKCHPTLKRKSPSRVDRLISAICKDCGQKGHWSQGSSRCSNNSNSAGTIALAKPVPFATEDDDPLVPFKTPFTGMVSHNDETIVQDRSTFKRKALQEDDLRFTIDSGCSQSLIHNKGSLKKYSQLFSKMNVADSTAPPLTCTGVGTLQLTSSIQLSNVLHAPTVALNLLSVAELTDIGCTVTFDQAKCVVKEITTGKVLLIGIRRNNLYEYTRTSHGQAYLTAQKPVTRMELFHRRMGHINVRDLRQLERLADGVSIPKEKEPFLCTHCIEAKSHRRIFEKSTSYSRRFGELTHTDVCYVGIESLNGAYTMFVLFTDDATRYSAIYLLRSKADVSATFADYDRKVFNYTGKRCQTIRSDNGTEYFNNLLLSYCSQHGIITSSSDRYTPQGNSRAERLNRTVLEGTSAMLFDKDLPVELWGYAAICFVHLKNRSPHSALRNTTPYEAKYQKLPDLSNVRVFGSTAYTHIPKQLRTGPGSKLLRKAKPMLFVGYSPRTSSWIMLDRSTGKEITSSEAYFIDEESTAVNNTKTLKLIDLFSNDAPHSTTITVQENNNNTSTTNTGLESNSNTSTANTGLESNSNTSTANTGLESLSDTNQEDNDDTRSISSGEQSEDSVDPILGLVNNTAINPDSHIVQLIACAAVSIITENDNPTFNEAMKGKFKHHYQKAILKEYKSLMDQKVFSAPMNLPPGKNALDTKMVLKRKEAEINGAERRFKARLCGKGFKQIFGVDYFETFSPVATYDALRVFLTLMVAMDFEIDSVDVITAFLLSALQEEVYIKIPDGYPGKEKHTGKVLRLLKSLYGLKQAPHVWNKELNGYLQEIGFCPTESEPCIYVGRFGSNGDTTVYILVYVDDLLIAAPNRSILQRVKDKIHKKFPIEDHGPLSFFLNMHFYRDRKNKTIKISQVSKIEKLLNDPRLSAEERTLISKPCKVPADPIQLLTKDMEPQTTEEIEFMKQKDYKSFIGILLYISITARPDLSPAVSAAARFSKNPGIQHWNAIIQILRYLQGTRNLVLQLNGSSFREITNLSTLAYADADWGTELDTRRSRSGYTLYLLNSLVVWSSKLQSNIALSSTEAEYIALSSCVRIVLWLRSLLTEMGFPQANATTIFEDNKSCIDIANSLKAHPAVKHIDIRHHFIRERISKFKDIKLRKESTLAMTADLFTKQLPYPAFSKHRESLGLVQHKISL